MIFYPIPINKKKIIPITKRAKVIYSAFTLVFEEIVLITLFSLNFSSSRTLIALLTYSIFINLIKLNVLFLIFVVICLNLIHRSDILFHIWSWSSLIIWIMNKITILTSMTTCLTMIPYTGYCFSLIIRLFYLILSNRFIMIHWFSIHIKLCKSFFG